MSKPRECQHGSRVWSSALDYLSPANCERKNRVGSLRGKHGLPTVGDCVAGGTPPVDNPAPDHIVRAENLST